MRLPGTVSVVATGCLLLASVEALAQPSSTTHGTTDGTTHGTPPGSAQQDPLQIQRWFELDAPFSRRLQIRFDTRPVPTFEPLRLPTFEGRGTLWKHDSLAVSLYERVAPALELDCRRTCAPILERSIGSDVRLSLGAIGRRFPDTFLAIGAGLVRMPWGFRGRTLIDFGGLLDL